MMDIFLLTGIALVSIGIFPLIRLVLGPTIPDRVVAFDTLNTLVVASLVSFGLAFKTATYIDVAIVYAILSFVATIYIARYLEG